MLSKPERALISFPQPSLSHLTGTRQTQTLLFPTSPSLFTAPTPVRPLSPPTLSLACCVPYCFVCLNSNSGPGAPLPRVTCHGKPTLLSLSHHRESSVVRSDQALCKWNDNLVRSPRPTWVYKKKHGRGQYCLRQFHPGLAPSPVSHLFTKWHRLDTARRLSGPRVLFAVHRIQLCLCA